MTAILLALAARVSWGQATLTRVEGKVRDGNKPVADVQVVLTFQDNGKAYKAKTDKNGEFSMVGLTRGAYTVEAFSGNGDAIYREKNRNITGAQGTAGGSVGALEKLDLDLAGPGGVGGQPKVSKEEIERIKTQNAKAQNLNVLISQYNAAEAARNWKEAEPVMKQMIEADPNNWKFYQALANDQYNLGEYEDAVATSDKGIQLAQAVVSGGVPADPKRVETDPAKAKVALAQMLTNEGNAYLKLKKNSEAVAAYTKAAEMDPNPGVAYFNLCATQYNTGNTVGALAACDKAIAADPNKADAYYIKGSLMLASSSLDKDGKVKATPGTAEALNKYLELAPDGPHAADVKQMLEYIGSKVETTFKGGKKK
jgi:tetratricopeptide (TPR) repeat protein